jgi:phage-related protein
MKHEKWEVLFLNDKVEDEFLYLKPDLKAHYWHIINLVKEFGLISIGVPHIKPLGNKLWEIRLKGKDDIARAIYTTIIGKRIVILHVFVKKTQKTPRLAIERALKRMKEL